MELKGIENMYNLYVASDQNGFEVKEQIIKYLKENENKYIINNVGTHFKEEFIDYPVYASMVSSLILEQLLDDRHLGILICKAGIGMSIAANKNKNIRATLCFSKESAKIAREEYNSNILILPGKLDTIDKPEEIVQTWLNYKYISNYVSIRQLYILEKLKEY